MATTGCLMCVPGGREAGADQRESDCAGIPKGPGLGGLPKGTVGDFGDQIKKEEHHTEGQTPCPISPGTLRRRQGASRSYTFKSCGKNTLPKRAFSSCRRRRRGRSRESTSQTAQRRRDGAKWRDSAICQGHVLGHRVSCA